jgi:hypothetical protein
MKFRIEYALDERHAYVFARQIGAGDFQVLPGSRLGGVAIKPWLSMPRATTPDGRADMMLFVFVLESASDMTRLVVGQIVELESPDQPCHPK